MGKTNRAQRKADAALRETRRVAERNRRRNAARRKRHKPTWAGRRAQVIRAWPRGARRMLFVIGLLLAVGGVWLIVAAEAEHVREEKSLVQTMPGREVQVLQEDSVFPLSKKGPMFMADIDGRLVPLEHGEFQAHDLADGDRIMVVIDPEDPRHVIAVGEPGSSGHSTENQVLGGILSGFFALGAVAMAGWLLLEPELRPWVQRIGSMSGR